MDDEKTTYVERMKPKISDVEERIVIALEQGNDKLLQQLTHQKDLLSGIQNEWLQRIESRWGTSSPNRLFIDDLFNKEVYSITDGGDEAHITVNTETEFYNRVYSKITQNSRLKILIDLMLSSLGYAEFMDMKTNPERTLYWQIAREEVSLHVDQFVRAMPNSEEEVTVDEA